MRHVFETMGTVASLVLPDDAGSIVPEVERVFTRADERFSLYRDDSELSRVARGELALVDASAELRETYDRAIRWSTATGGWFTPHRPDGVIDLNGVVKAEAIDEAGEVLDSAGMPHWSLNVGGDILVRDTSRSWITGVADPADRAALICSVALGGADRRALATSGSAERGDHIWSVGAPGPREFVQVSVIAADIVTADVLATAIVAGGRTALDDITNRWSVDVLTVDRAGELLITPGFLEGGARGA